MRRPGPDSLVAGLDVGGTKVAVRVETVSGTRVLDERLPADGWEAEPAEHAAGWLADRLARVLPAALRCDAVGVGAQGCNTRAIGGSVERALAQRGLRARVVNDAALLVPAAGLETGFGVVAGTGAIAVGTTSHGDPCSAGGWGWVLGDDAGATGLVREATRTVLAAADAGLPLDPLGRALLAAFAVDDAEHLARAVNDDPRVERWAPHARAVFAAADAGSMLAVGVVDHAADHLVGLVASLAARGCVGSAVVAGGSVVRGQPRLATALATRLAALDEPRTLVVLDDEPVAGAVELARRLVLTPRP
ncbi:ATPase [Luteimicrobium album]|uniref:ATPase n=1 Tax=Luteimicrobium album TaxID=1054550 RepID=A0ABQ6I0M7_9MICO|nr:BadF/BadG/BcrA/BcrD ATPase family protein [Luteimicrobium album]GMA23519.1 ATPase [Luteimicrobium album]